MDILTTSLLVLFALLQVADAWTTITVLSKGGSELNPLMKKAFDKLGAPLAFAVIKTALVVLVAVPTYLGMFAPYNWQILGIFNAFYCFILINNVIALRKLND